MTAPEVRKPDTLVVTGKSAGGSPIAWTFTKAGLTACTLAGRGVLAGGTAPISVDHLLDPEEGGRDVVGSLQPPASFNVTGNDRCTVSQVYDFVFVSQRWTASGEDAICELKITNRDLTQPIHYPALGGLTASWATTPTGIACSPWWTEQQLPYLKRDVLSPNYWDRLRCSYLAGGGVGVAVLPLDLGDEKCFVEWQGWGQPEIPPYTSRWWRVVWDRPIAPGQSRTMRLGLRVSDREDWRALLEAWKGVVG